MATIIANRSTDFNDIDLNAIHESWLANAGVPELEIRNITWADHLQSFEDANLHHVGTLSALNLQQTWSTGYTETGVLGINVQMYSGTGLTQDESGLTSGGTVRLIGEYNLGVIPSWVIHGISISGAALGRAFATDSVADDYAIFSRALSGNDRFYLSNEADLARGYAGNDIMFGRGGQDDLRGDAGNDRISGGGGSDYLYGGSGADRIAGNAGIDFLYGGLGRDRLTGGAGADQFHFTSMRDSTLTRTDVITDFRSGTDVIRLMEIDASTGRDGNNAFVFLGTAAFGTDIEGGVRYERVNNAGTANDYTMVYLDNDGDAGAEGAIRINGLHTLTAHDFLL